MTDEIALGASAEAWLPVVGFEHRYLVSDQGRIRNWCTGKLLFGEIDRDGYRRVNFAKEGRSFKRRVHRLVCQSFHGPAPEAHEVGHLDGKRTNNRATNLAWVTRSENVRQAIGHGTHVGNTQPALAAMQDRRGHRNPQAKFTANQVAEMRTSRAAGWSERVIAKAFGCSNATAHRIVSGGSYVG